MAVQAKTACEKCNITFALAEARETHKGKDYHPDCWAKHREEALRLMLRLGAAPLPFADVAQRDHRFRKRFREVLDN